MPIKIPNKLPAKKVLEEENIFVMSDARATHQDIRPLKVAILNLMPTKITTETQLLRLLGNTPLQIEIDLIKTGTYASKNTDEKHLIAFYKTFDQIRHLKYDGLIVTGAPVETMNFEDVLYWCELTDIFDWAKTNVFSSFFICWGAQAALYHYYGVPKYMLQQKISGIYEHKTTVKNCPLLRGFDDHFFAPHSRYTENRESDIRKIDQLEILATSDIAGIYIAATNDLRQIFVTGHGEYDADTLAQEYHRDLEKEPRIAPPYNYFPQDDPKNTPPLTWRSHSNLLFSNWNNYCIYQNVPYDFTKLS